MSAFKQFLSSDITVTPFEVSKGFSYEGQSELTDSGGGVDRFLGKNISGLFDPNTDPTTGTISTQYQRLIYNSTKELYYSNYLSSSFGDNVNTAILIPGTNEEGNRFVGLSSSPGLYDNYLQTTLTFKRYFPTGSNDIIAIFSVPSGLYGNYIQPKSFYLSVESGSIRDDGEGNLINQATGKVCGNIIYPHGLAIVTSDGSPSAGYGAVLYGNAVYGGAGDTFINNLITSTNISCSFSSSLTIHETQYKCTIGIDEYNYSNNPSLISGSEGQLYDFATGSYFSPYVTTVGLYDEAYNLLAVGKLAKPLATSRNTDTTILVNIDR